MIKPTWNGCSVVIRVYNESGNVIETQRAQGRFQRSVLAPRVKTAKLTPESQIRARLQKL
jgi:hypothetical protein